jgi:hypothetical protein
MRPRATPSLLLQPWYTALETMRYLLPDDQAREKLAGQAWQVSSACCVRGVRWHLFGRLR